MDIKEACENAVLMNRKGSKNLQNIVIECYDPCIGIMANIVYDDVDTAYMGLLQHRISTALQLLDIPTSEIYSIMENYISYQSLELTVTNIIEKRREVKNEKHNAKSEEM